uniref:Alpha-1,2-mannosidase n=1 Tax=Alexandrium monilatum TaxID=311494 RepID=A0A7S4QCR5_9DINO
MGRRRPPHMRLPCFAAGLVATWPTVIETVESPEDFPDLLTGSFTDGRKFSTGNTLPLIARPWGFNHWSIQTNNGMTSWWFGGSDHEFHWIRLTHQPSPWIGDWAFLNFGPQMGGRVDEPVMFFEPWGAKIKPYTLDATLGPDNMRVQLTPTDHGAVLKVTFPEVNPRHYEKRICFKLPPWNKKQSPGSFGASNSQDMWMEVTSTRAESVPANFALYVRAEVDVANLRYSQGVHQRITTGAGLQCFEFSPMETAVTVWVGTSLISTEQARLNLEREVRGRRFEEVEDECRYVWRGLLSRVDVVDPGPMTEETFRRVGLFYTGLYRSLLFPRRLDEIDASGRRVHYSPYDRNGGVHEGILVADTGFWDTFRTVYPLLTLVYPQEVGEIITGWLNAFKEGTWLPEWSSPGYRSCMVGTYADVVVADAVIKDIPGVDAELAWKALWRDSFVSGGQKGQGGKLNYDEYDRRGFIPAERGDSVSGTLDFAFSDFSVSLVAEKLGKTEDVQRLRRRALSAREHLFDRGLGLMRPKMSNGQFKNGDPAQWGDGFVEGSSWHHSFPAFDLPGLAALHGSSRKLAQKIHEMVTTPGTFTPGTYRTVIHEMEEMRALAMGQYGHNNQPVHHILWLLMMLDEAAPECNASAPLTSGAFCPRRLAEDHIGAVLRKAYSRAFYAGDEDNGEMGAWYVLAGLGLFESAPGTYQGYTMGSPLFRRVEIHRDPVDSRANVDGATKAPSLTILSPSVGQEEVVHVSRVLLNGQDVGRSSALNQLNWALRYDRLVSAMPDAVLHFVSGAGGADAGKVATAAPGTGVAPSNAAEKDRLFMKQRIHSLEHEIEVLTRQQQQLQLQRRALEQRTASPPDPRPGTTAPPPPASQGRSTADNSLIEAQRLQIRQLEKQLEVLKRPSKPGPESDVSTGLATTVEMAFFILAAVNFLGWVLCICYRRGGKVSPSASSRKSKRASIPNGKRRHGDDQNV